MDSREKGKRGERELAKFLRYLGWNCRRGQQYSGANGDADVVGVDHMHIECKRVEKLNIEKAYDQAVRDARPDEIPVVMHKKNNGTWLATLSLEHFMQIWGECKAANEVDE